MRCLTPGSRRSRRRASLPGSSCRLSTASTRLSTSCSLPASPSSAAAPSRSGCSASRAVYLPAYHPLYGHAHEAREAARRLIEGEAALWIPIVLHWGWEADEDWAALARLLELIGPYAAHWDDFLAEVEASRAVA